MFESEKKKNQIFPFTPLAVCPDYHMMPLLFISHHLFEEKNAFVEVICVDFEATDPRWHIYL